MQYHGVKIATPGKSWSVTASVAGRPVYLGVFPDPQQAARAFDLATFQATGDLRRLNFPEDFREATVDLMCRACGEVKPVASFRVPTFPLPKTLWHCDVCRQKISDDRRQRYFTKHQCSPTTRHKRQSVTNGLKSLLRAAAYRADERNLPFALDLPVVRELWERQGGRCALTGRVMRLAAVRDDLYTAASIDQIRPGKGYTKDNVQLTCWAANVAKQALTTQEFLDLCRDVVTTLGGVAQ